MNIIKKFLRKLIFAIYLRFSKFIGKFLTTKGLRWISYKINVLFWHDFRKKMMSKTKSVDPYELNLYLQILSTLLNYPLDQKRDEINHNILKNLVQINSKIVDALYKFDSNQVEEELNAIKDASKKQLKLITFNKTEKDFNQEDYSIKLDEDLYNELVKINIREKLDDWRDQIKDISVIYPFRDRSVERLELSIKSLLKYASKPFNIVVVDYGSKQAFKENLENFCKDNNIILIRTETEGRPWSRSQALNIGIGMAQTTYIATTDIDMIFEGDVLGESIKSYESNSKIHCRPFWLREDRKRENAWLGDYFQLGGYMFIEKNLLNEYGYFNNSIYYWGIEDIELNIRLKNKGVKDIWIDDKVKMYHMWHTPSYGDFDLRPTSSWFDSNLTLIQSILKAESHAEPKQKVDVNKVLTEKDRPILNMIGNKESYVLHIKDFINQLKEINDTKQANKFIYLDLGNRIVNTNSKVIKSRLKYIDQFFNENGAEIGVLKNKNFDFFYLSLNALKESDLIDYYIKEDFSGVYLLFK